MYSAVRVLCLYVGSAAVLLWPSVRTRAELVPGAERGDLWNGLWSFWAGAHPAAERLLGFPDGGVVPIADPVNGWLAAVPLGFLSLSSAWVLLAFLHVVAAGWFTDRLARRLGVSGVGALLAGLTLQWAPIQVSALHNGSTEAVGAGWLAAAVFCTLWALEERGGWARVVLAGAVAGVCAVSSWYAGVCLGIWWLFVGWKWVDRAKLGRALLLVLFAAAVAVPFAVRAHEAATGPESLVRIKSDRETALVRRTTGAVDPVALFRPGDYRSPDFRVISRYGEDFIHCPYLGWVVLCLAGVGFRRRRETRWLAALAGIQLVLSLGPVWVSEAQPVLFAGERVLPLPFVLLDSLPGFASLTLLYRLTLGGLLALAVMAGAGLNSLWSSKAVRRWFVLPLVVLEYAACAPTAGLPAFSSAALSPALSRLAAAPDGAVLNFPVVGGRRYLYEQTVYDKPLAASLNFPNNPAAQRGWEVLDAALRPTEVGHSARTSASAIESAMRPLGIRYVVVHDDEQARPDMHDGIVSRLEGALSPLADSDGVAVYALW